MWREPVAKLARVRRQVYTDLLELVYHQPGGGLVARKVSVQESLALFRAADDGPHQQVRDVNSNRLRKA